ncbi:hypothetical protein WNY98_10365 [Pseudoalteromonas sp. AS71]|uniref:McrB family protein n=1 Tax=Pseudoalteromonas sp. AS71 TaxID=3135777 RepID=UPI00318127D3
MGYVTQKDLIDCRHNFSKLTKRGDTFLGLLLYCINIKEWLIPLRHAKADMKEFSLLADKAFGVVEPDSNYSEKEWYALFSKSWLDDISTAYLNGKKIPALDVCITIFWWMEFDSTEQAISFFKKQLPADIYSTFFYEEENSTLDFSSGRPCARKDLLKQYGGNHDHKALKLGGDLIKKKAGELSGAPFAQTLYAASEIKHIVNITDFDVFENFGLSLGRKSNKFTSTSSSSPGIEAIISKPFLLLAGISGTGKTRFVREQAKTSKQFSETYCLTSVRPDWHEPSDLLGYISRLTQDGSAEYITTDVLDFIAKAWRAIADGGLNVEVRDSDELGEHLVVAGERDALEQVLPYWLCLDEMNLAPVEQYFADYLSVLETREWTWTGDSFSYSSDALLKPATIKAVANKEKLREALGFNGTQYDELWALICQYGLGIPFNLLVAGTVNMDETTHGFSRKVIDRALSFDFGEFFPNDYADFFTPTNRNKRLSYPIWSNASKSDLANTFDVDGTKTVAFLSAVNAVLKNTPFELAFRALNELLLAVASSQPQDDLTLKAVWDDFMMCKVLPRIEGDEDKLVGQNQHNILEALLKVLEEQLAGAWENGRPDLYREELDPEGETITVDCRSKKKLSWMNDQLVRGFTSFWP